MAELKKCPFCGGEVSWVSGSIQCKSCDLKFRKYSDMELNNQAWNNRATEAEIRAKAIDEFAEKLNKKITDFVLEHQSQLTFVSGVSMGWKFVDEIAEQLKEEQ